MRFDRKERSGFSLVVLVLGVIAVMASQAGTQGTAELYELTQINQYLTENQLRWFAEGAMNYHLANRIQAGPPAPWATDSQNWVLMPGQLLLSTVPAAPLWNAGTMSQRAWTTWLSVTFTMAEDVPGSDGTRFVTGQVRWQSTPGVAGTLIHGQRRVSRRYMGYNAAANPRWTNGIFVMNE